MVPLLCFSIDFSKILLNAPGIYIRRTKTKSLDQGEGYYTYRIVESVRIGQHVKQGTKRIGKSGQSGSSAVDQSLSDSLLGTGGIFGFQVNNDQGKRSALNHDES